MERMKRIWISMALIIPAGLIVYLILGDFVGNKLQQEDKNPYALEVDTFKEVDPALVKYREIKRINLSHPSPKAVAYQNGKLGLAYENYLQLIDTTGLEIYGIALSGPVTAIAFSPRENLFVGCGDRIEIYDLDGNASDKWQPGNAKTLITALAFKEERVFAADAGNKIVHIYDYDGNPVASFEGRGRMEGNHGFIIPSSYFDLEVDPDNQLWVTNPGMLYLENYSDEGKLRAFWGEASFDIDGFTGCCNPAHFTFLPDGSFVTSEKGITRIKVYKPSGELDGVVATPQAFDEDSEPPDVAVDTLGRIYALDITRNMVRIFEKKAT